MAIRPHEVTITRQQMSEVLKAYAKSKSDKSLYDYLQAWLTDDLMIEDQEIDTSDREDLPQKMMLVDLLMADIESYA